jgi:hypothetical protein
MKYALDVMVLCVTVALILVVMWEVFRGR